MKQVRLESINKSFYDPKGRCRSVLKSIDLELNDGEFVALVGPNGSGKSTLLNLIAGLLSPDSGRVLFSPNDASPSRTGYVWQRYADSLLPWFTAQDNVALPLRARDHSWSAARKRAATLLQEFLPEVPLRARTYELSGGQQQMISVLRAVCADPDILLLDEPFSALDQHRSWQTALFVEGIWLKRKIPILFVSHDVDEAVLLADRVVFLSAKLHFIHSEIRNPLSHPRNLEMLTYPEHVHCRNHLIKLFQEEERRDASTT